MTDAQNQRDELPPPNRPGGFRHLFPIVRVLMGRGHLPIGERGDYGFDGGQGLTKCHLTHALTDEDWAAVNERLIIPENIIWWNNVIRDQENGVQIQGDETIIDFEGEIPIKEWMARQDWSDLPPT